MGQPSRRTVTFSVAPNTVPQVLIRYVQVRSGATFAGAPRVTIVQVGAPGCVTGFSPSTLDIPVSGGRVSFNVLTSSDTCTWGLDGTLMFAAGGHTYAGGTFWEGAAPAFLLNPFDFLPPGRTGPSTVTFSNVLPNPNPSPVSLTLFFGGQPLPVAQPGNNCVLTVSALSPATMPANGGTGTFTVDTSGSPCSYVILRPDDGVTIVSGGSGNTFPATVTLSVSPNPAQWPMTRRVYVSSTGSMFYVTGVDIAQKGPPVATDATTVSFAVHRPGTGSVYESPPEPLRITNTEDPAASWAVSTSEPWLVVSPSSGTSPATATISLNPAAVAVLTPRSYAGTIWLSSPVAPDSPRRVDVYLHVTDATSTTSWPGGVLDIPREGAIGPERCGTCRGVGP